ncbi:hypothetical protein SteCoe_19740 [Stentor coeruleus]|uniref:Uncharacterized protein n=1 Tax=Stentor coeruleus TaxID=5963 RepID=A0A1R2BTF1_9CILI|nr:hypothetical protein SteCoe_19740 [Stentor coeruleus]
MLGIDDESIKQQVLDKSQTPADPYDEFKILILTRGIIDKFSNKNQTKSMKRFSDIKPKYPLFDKVRLISEQPPSKNFEQEQIFQGNQYLVTLHKACHQEQIKLTIPESIILGTSLDSPIKLWTDDNGFVCSKTFRMLELKSELQNFKQNWNYDTPMYLMRYEHYSSNKTLYQSFVFKCDEVEEILQKFHESSYIKGIVLITQFVKSKGSQPSKTRAHFTKNSLRVFLINNSEPKEFEKKLERIKVTNFIPAQLLNSLIFSKTELDVFERNFRCKLVFPIKSTSSYFLKEEYEIDFGRFAYNVFTQLQNLINLALRNDKYSKHLTRLKHFSRYLTLKFSKIEKSFEFYSKSKQTDKTSVRKLWERGHMVKATELSKIYEVSNLHKQNSYLQIHNEILKSLRHYIPHTKQVQECVLDFIEAKNSTFFTKLLHIKFKDRKIVTLPSISSTKHISLFSATEGSGYIKGKINRQLLCCGDYCSLLKKNDFETREKIEFLMKHHLEFAGTLFELMKLQDILNIDTVHHLLDRTKRPVTPITNMMQYKVLRKIILEDRYDKYSLRSLILNLPHEFIRDLNIILQENTSMTELSIPMNSNSQMNNGINKKLHWEFELVPVCDKCYKIYSKRIQDKRDSSLINKLKIPKSEKKQNSMSMAIEEISM